jgi:hypothetical protein
LVGFVSIPLLNRKLATGRGALPASSSGEDTRKESPISACFDPVLVFVLHRAVNRPAMFVKKLVEKASKKVRLLSLTPLHLCSPSFRFCRLFSSG